MSFVQEAANCSFTLVSAQQILSDVWLAQTPTRPKEATTLRVSDEMLWAKPVSHPSHQKQSQFNDLEALKVFSLRASAPVGFT